ncbi:MAG: hypothetical protein P8X80_20225, partial [Desulfobacterales bacterium]
WGINLAIVPVGSFSLLDSVSGSVSSDCRNPLIGDAFIPISTDDTRKDHLRLSYGTGMAR